MSVPIVFLPEAEADIVAARNWYEDQSTGLGQEFLESLQISLAKIEENPEGYGQFRRGMRAATLRRFPYVVYYRIELEFILIIAVQHGRRSARTWIGRLN